MAEIIEIDEFEVAFVVGGGNREDAMRRFSTLLLDTTLLRRYGSNGIVSKAHNVFGETFAIKRLRGSFDATPAPDIPPAQASSGSIAAFRKEYENQLAVSNVRGFPKLFGFGYAGPDPLILMEWVEGTSLADLFDKGAAGHDSIALDAQSILAIGAAVFSILSNLDALSSRPVHRDLSPSNIIIKTSARSLEEQIATRDFDICIIDFGSTTLLGGQDPSFTAITNIVRHATPEYAPPEMLNDALPNVLELRQSPSIDVYAACSILYEALTGHTPYRVSEHPNEMPYLVKTRTTLTPLQVPGFIEASNMIMRGLNDNQSLRPSAREMRDALTRGSGSVTSSSLAAPSSRASSQVPVAAPMAGHQVWPMHRGGNVRDASFARATPHLHNVSKPPVRAKRRRGIASYAPFIIAAIVILLIVIGALFVFFIH